MARSASERFAAASRAYGEQDCLSRLSISRTAMTA
jgi:hypothetical protein